MLHFRKENIWLNFEFIWPVVIVSLCCIWEISLFIVKVIKIYIWEISLFIVKMIKIHCSTSTGVKTLATYNLKLHWVVLRSHVLGPNGLEYDWMLGSWNEACYSQMVSHWFRVVFLVFKMCYLLSSWLLWVVDQIWKVTWNFLWLGFGTAKKEILSLG